MQARITIITPSFNQGRYLEQNILSVISQQYPDTEHIIIDGGSTDNTKSVLEKYKNKLAYVVSEPDKGQADAVNKGFAKATGEIIGWLNSDDYYAPGALQAVSKAFSNPTVNVVAGSTIIFDEKGKERKTEPTVTEKKNLNYHLRFPDINQPSTFFRRSVMAEFMPLNTELHYIMDRELWIKYIQQYGTDNTLSIDDVLVYFRTHSESKSTGKRDEFDNEYATVLRHFALLNNMNDVAALLESRYTINLSYTYSFPKHPGKETALNMVRNFFLRRGTLVFTPEQFKFAKEAYPILDIKDYRVIEEEKSGLERAKSLAGCINWLHFRTKRKINHLRGAR
jgi:glycosyltransferase involved in cell wall biosynthesis